MELIQDHGQRRLTAINFHVVLLGLMFLYLVQNKQPGHPKQTQKRTAAPGMITPPNAAEVFSSHEQKGPY